MATIRLKASETMNAVVYNIPEDLVPTYRDRRMVVRTRDLNKLVAMLPDGDQEHLQFVQLLSADIDPEDLDIFSDWGQDVPIDILLKDPVQDFPLLYHFSKLLDKHPIRVSISVKPGFIKAVKLAAALNFAVKLVISQPDGSLIDEIAEALEMYIHRSSVSQPIDFFHGMFLSSYRQEPASLWMIQEDDPDHFRFVSDDGEESISPRFEGNDPALVTPYNGSSECGSCEFKTKCGGYFKWPDPDYSCDGVKTIFRTIENAAKQLQDDVDSMYAMQGGPQPL